MATHTKNIAFLGTGNMNGAILKGLLSAGTDPATVRATTRSRESAQWLIEEYGIHVEPTESNPLANVEAAEWADIIILGVKPKDILALSREIASSLKEGAVVVSVAAGVTLAMMEKELPGAAIIRCMPNTPSSIQMGVLSISPNSVTSDHHLAAVASVLSGAGEVVRIPEEQINALIAVSGSGPAYAFYLAEAMAATGVRLGLAPELASKLAALTIRGAGGMLGENDDAEALRLAVTSPQGTTARAIETFDECGMREAIARGQEACAARAAELEEQLSRQE